MCSTPSFEDGEMQLNKKKSKKKNKQKNRANQNQNNSNINKFKKKSRININQTATTTTTTTLTTKRERQTNKQINNKKQKPQECKALILLAATLFSPSVTLTYIVTTSVVPLMEPTGLSHLASGLPRRGCGRDRNP